ncbi:MAG: cytochrome c [Candidatus Binatia bacterium]|nr:MAG: cytochrome c [Candidatus Binatia bacterium]
MNFGLLLICLHSGLVLISPAAGLDIATAISRAVQLAPELRAAEERIASAQGQWYQAGRWQNPVAELRGENWRISSDLRADNPALDFFATISQLFELGGKRDARRAIAWAGIDFAREQARFVRQQMAVATASVFLNAVRVREELQVVAESTETVTVLHEIARRRVTEGRLAEAEQRKLQAELGRLATLAAELEANQSVALQQLRQLLREPEIEAAVLVAPTLPTPPVDSSQDSALVEQVLQRHPEYRAVLAEKERAQHTLELEQARRIPDPTITGGYKRTDHRDTLVAAVVIPIPVFDTNWGNVQKATAEVAAANAGAEAIVIRLRNELLGLLTRWRSSAARARAAQQEMVEPAASVRRAAQVAFREGSGDLLALVDAERVYLEVRRSALASWAEATLAGQTWLILRGDVEL